MIGIYLFSAFITILYLWLILYLNNGWSAIPEYITIHQGKTFVTVIIPFRNEEDNITLLLAALKNQKYDNNKWDIIFVDDHSIDNSAEIIRSFISNFPKAELISLPLSETGKKSALAHAAIKTNAELLLFTDADCIMGDKWISSVVSYYEENKNVFISAPVLIQSGNSFFSKFQRLEFLSLSGSGAASFGNSNPIMTNGANMAVKRDIYLESLEYLMENTPSGDDIFLLLHLKKKYPDKLGYLKSKDAIVNTSPMPDLSSFIKQRLRWVSKARYYSDKYIIATAIIVFLINLLLLVSFVMGFIISDFFIVWILIFILKSIIDYRFLRKISKFMGSKISVGFFIINQLIYFFYIVFTGFLGNLISIKWKERKIKI